MRNEYEKRFFQKEDGTPITDNTIKMYFQDLKESTGIIRLHPHLLRHTFATTTFFMAVMLKIENTSRTYKFTNDNEICAFSYTTKNT